LTSQVSILAQVPSTVPDSPSIVSNLIENQTLNGSISGNGMSMSSTGLVANENSIKSAAPKKNILLRTKSQIDSVTSVLTANSSESAKRENSSLDASLSKIAKISSDDDKDINNNSNKLAINGSDSINQAKALLFETSRNIVILKFFNFFH
jgi:hypothetical protein